MKFALYFLIFLSIFLLFYGCVEYFDNTSGNDSEGTVINENTTEVSVDSSEYDDLPPLPPGE